MLIDETTKSNLVNSKTLGERIVREGLELWKKQQEFAKLKKFKEQQELREMLEKYNPFGHGTDMKPRGLRNLRLEGLFPYKDNLKAKRFVGTLDLGKPGGGAPMVTDTGKKMTRTHEDHLLRFQFGSNDLRRCVDNTYRYKTNKRAQEEYKKELDKLVEEKRKSAEQQRLADLEFEQKQFLKSPPWGKQGPGGFAWRKPNEIGLNFFKSLGWSTEKTLQQLDTEKIQKDPEKPAKTSKKPPHKNRKLSPLLDGKEYGIELVPLLAKQRRFPLKIHLGTTDVTNEKKICLSSLWNRQGSAYLKELNQQMAFKQEKSKETKAQDEENVRHHFSTLDGFWGRPGHGAPKSTVKMQRLDRLLYPQMVPISVH